MLSGVPDRCGPIFSGWAKPETSALVLAIPGRRPADCSADWVGSSLACHTRVMQWPEDFWWGTGASSTQCEGAAPASDWWDWERAGHAPFSGDGNGSVRGTRKTSRLASLGLTHHRLSVEWARLEPEPGVHDQAAIRHYRDVLTAAHEAGVAPWVCLHHFTLPRWFLASGGFLVESNRTEVWRRHVDFVADAFGDLVAGWQPVNETNYYARAAYGGRGWPPGHNDPAEVATANEAIHLANAEAAVRLRTPGHPSRRSSGCRRS